MLWPYTSKMRLPTGAWAAVLNLSVKFTVTRISFVWNVVLYRPATVRRSGLPSWLAVVLRVVERFT